LFRAYLAHSSEDKPYVDQVIHRLGRAHIVYDSVSFTPGIDFRISIRDGLDKSRVFVFFASKKSLESTWVKFEIVESEWRLIKGQMAGALTIIIDEETEPHDLPHWMQRCLARKIIHPKIAVHTIQSYLIKETGDELAPIFVGREQELAEMPPRLITEFGVEVPRILIFSGLEGIGRRTFARKVISNYLSFLDISPQFILEETDTPENLYVQLLDETTSLETRDQLAKNIEGFRKLTGLEQGLEIARLLKIIVQNNIVPFIVDTGFRGVLLDDANWYRDEWLNILRGIKSYEDVYVVLIQPRLPHLSKITENATEIPKIAYHRLPPLSDRTIELLLRESFRRRNIVATNEQIVELAPYLNGYPPAVKLAIAYIELYGISALIADKGILADFFIRRFDPLLKKLNLEINEREILRLLATETQLPLEAFATLLNCSVDEVSQIIQHLIDTCLVIPTDSDYMISSPIRVAVSNSFGLLSKSEYSKVADKLIATFWKDTNKIPAFSIVDTTIHALAYSKVGELDHFRDVILPAQLSRVAKQKYDAQEWKEAEELAKRALKLDPHLFKAKVTLFRCLVRLRKWKPAEEVLSEIDGTWALERFYLRGFLEWKRGDHRKAVFAFRKGWYAGDESVSILRDLANCLFHLGEVDEAKKYVDIALEKYKRNEYILDLAALIAIYKDADRDAESYILQLKEISEDAYHHRLATLKGKRKAWPEALQHAEIACGAKAPRFEVLAQRADILIELQDPRAEEEINKLQPLEIARDDVKQGLLCKLYVRRGQWKRAEDYYRRIRKKELPVHQALYLDILRLKTKDAMLSLPEREKAADELEGVTQLQLPLTSDAEDIN